MQPPAAIGGVQQQLGNMQKQKPPLAYQPTQGAMQQLTRNTAPMNTFGSGGGPMGGGGGGGGMGNGEGAGGGGGGRQQSNANWNNQMKPWGGRPISY